ncbi:hypothetical protein Tco_0602326 [Tanacetum coccineum]
MMVQAQEEIGEGSAMPTDPHHTPIIQPSTSQPQKKQSRRKQRKDTKIPQSSGPTEPIADEAANEENVPTQSNDPPLSRVNTLGSGEDRLKLKELIDLYTKLSDRVLDLETTKTAQAKEIASLKKRVKKLERKRKSKTPGMKRLFKIGRSAQVVSSEDEGLGDQEDASKQGRKIDDIDQDAEVTLVDETQGRYDDAQMFDTDVFNGEEVFVAEQSEKVVEEVVSTAEVSAAATITTEEITLAQALAELRSAKPKIVVQEPVQSTTTTTPSTIPKAKSITFRDPSESTTRTTLTSIPSNIKDKGKAKMIEPEKPLKMKEQIRLDEELAFKLQAEEEEQARLAREKAEKVEEANISWDNVQAMIEADRLLAERLQAREQEELTDEEKARLFVELLEKRKKHFAALRAQEKRNKPPTKAQKKSTMSTYLKNMAAKSNVSVLNDFLVIGIKSQDIVMSDSEDSTVTYTVVSSPFGGMSYIGSPRVDGPPVMPEDPYAYVVAAFQAPPSPDYVPGPEEPEQAPLSPEFVPEPIYPEFMPSEDEIFPTEEQLLPADVSPTADSPGYIADSNLEEDEDDPEEDPIDYPVDGGDDDDGDDESSDDDENDDDVEEDEDEEGDSNQPPTPFWSEAWIARLLAIPSPPPLLLSQWSSPLPQIPSPPLPVSSLVPISPPPLPAIPTYPLGYRAAMIRQRVESPSTSHSLLLPPLIILSHTRASVAMMRAVAPSTYILVSRSETPSIGTPPLLPIPLPIPSPPLLLPSTDRKADKPEVCLPPQKRLCIALGPRYEFGESSSTPAARPTGGFRADYGFVTTLDREIRRDPEIDVGYGIIDTWDEMLEGMPGAPATDETKLVQRMTNLITTREARLSHEAWGRSMDASNTARSEVRALRTTILAQQTEIAALRAADRT